MQNVEQFYLLVDEGRIPEANRLFEKIHDHLKPILEKMIQKRVGRQQYSRIGEDILQTVFADIHKQLSNPKRRWIKGKVVRGKTATFETWACSFVKFKSIDGADKEKRHHRKRKDLEFAMVEKASPDIGPLLMLSFEDFKNRVMGQIGKLPDLPRKMILRSIDGCSGVEIGMEFNTTAVEVSRNLKKARNFLLETKTF